MSRNEAGKTWSKCTVSRIPSQFYLPFFWSKARDFLLSSRLQSNAVGIAKAEKSEKGAGNEDTFAKPP